MYVKKLNVQLRIPLLIPDLSRLQSGLGRTLIVQASGDEAGYPVEGLSHDFLQYKWQVYGGKSQQSPEELWMQTEDSEWAKNLI